MRKFLLTAMVPSLFLIASCGGGDETAASGAEETSAESVDTSVKLEGDAALLPEGLTKMPGMRTESSEEFDRDGEGKRRRSTVAYTKDTTTGSISDFYEKELEALGFELKSKTDDGKTSNVRGTKDNAMISVTSRDTHSNAEEGESYSVMMYDFDAVGTEAATE